MSLDVDGRSLEISNENKVFFPDGGITKGDVVRYYRRIAAWMLPWLGDRAVVMHRFPDGIDGQDFIQKQAPAGLPDWLETVTLHHAGGTTTDYVVCRDAATLVALADLGCVVPHIWLSRASQPHVPDQFIIDLDPPGALDARAIERVRLAAGTIHDLLGSRDLPSFVKSSGSRGLHIHVPVREAPGFDEVRRLASDLSRRVAREHPDDLTVAQRKADRGDRLYLDVMRNGYGQHAVAPYAIRALPTAPVAVPLDWSEVRDVEFHPRRITLRNVFRRLGQKDDPWADLHDAPVPYDQLRQSIRGLR
jgi:bifunctional non-homologous end joining protein LigD